MEINKNKTIIIISILLILITLIIYKISTHKEKYFNNIETKSYHNIINLTNKNYLDTIVHAGLQYIDIDTVNIVILPMIKLNNNEDIDIEAFITQNSIYYNIFITDKNRYDNIRILSHELIHLKQYYDKKLKLTNDSKIVIWKNDTINMLEYKYEDRPWEQEASSNQYELISKIKNILY